MGGRRPPSSFSSVTSANVGISPKNFLTFSFNPFATWYKISSLYLVPVPNYELEPRPPLKKSGFSGQILIKLRL